MNKVAVIMSVYKLDNVSFFKESVYSILNQSEPVDIYICCDGPIPFELDSAVEVFESYDSVRIVRNPINMGLAHSLNKLIDIVSASNYSYIARMDSDDISSLNRIKLQLDFLEINKAIDVLGSACHEFGASFCLSIKKLPLSHDDLVRFSVYRCPFIHPTVMFRASVFESGIRYPVNTSYTEDLALWYELILSGFKFANLPDSLLRYRLNESTLERRTGMKKALDEFSLRYRFMIKSNRFSFKLIFLVFFRALLALSPSFLKKGLYKYVR